MPASLADYDFPLPARLIAQAPARPRDAARLLHVAATLHDHGITDLPTLLRPGDRLIVNDTRVIPARLHARRGDARIELLLNRADPDGTWHALARNARRLRAGDTLTIDGAPGLAPRVVARDPDGTVRLDFGVPPATLAAALAHAGETPLPPYITRVDGPTPADADDYQTIFAAHPGAVAAPTAGLHFTPRLLAALEARGIDRTAVTLHVGAGTFLPPREDAIATLRLHAELGAITPAAAAGIAATRAAGGRIVAVGTTALRLLESAADAHGTVRAFAGLTDLVLRPGHRFRTADALLTNFHLPRSTLFLLTCAFAGEARMRAAYAHAIAREYRFYSYGDACLLERGPTP